MWHYRTTQSQYCNNDNDDNLMHIIWWIIFMSKHVIYEREM